MVELFALVLVSALGRSPMPTTHHPEGEVRAFSYDFAQPQRVEVGGTGPTRVSVLNQVPMPVWGYGILQVGIDNSAGPSQVVQLRYLSHAGGGSRTVERAVEVRAGERLQLALPVPAALRYGRLQVRAPGVVDGTEPSVYFTYLYRPQRALLALGASEDFEQLAGQRPVNADPAALVTVLDPHDAPTELAGYVGYDLVAVARGTLESLPPGVQRALEAYAATGGVLVLGEAGNGTLAALPLLEGQRAPPFRDQYGFGSVSLAQGTTEVEAVFNTGVQPVRPQGARPSSARRGFGTGAGADEVLLPQALAPLGRFLIIIVLFTLAIGPGSFWVARRKGPGALLLTIPATAFVTCALIIGYSLVRDGFTVHASVHGYSLLDPPRNRVITASTGAFYANLAPGKAVFPASSAVVSPWENNVEAQAAGLAWGEGARFGSDFLPSRSYREWSVVGVEPTRARLLVKADGSALKVQNALGARVDHLVLSWKGYLYELRDLRDGGEKALVHVSGPPPQPQLGALAATRFDAEVGARTTQGLREGEYVALLDGPGFAQLGGLRLSHHQSSHLVRGSVHR